MELKIIAIAGILLAGAGTASLAGSPDAFLKHPLKRPLATLTVGLSFDQVNPYLAVYDRAFRAFTAELGVRAVILDSQGEVARQPANIRDLVAQQVDVIIVMANNPKTAVPALKEAHDAGIPVVLSNSQIDASADAYVSAWTGPDHYRIGLQAGESLAKALGGKGNVAIIVGNPGGWASVERERGTRDALARYPAMKVVDSQPSDWKREKAQSVTEAFISRYGRQLDGIVAADDGIALGALNAVDAAVAAGNIGKDQVKITSGNAFSAGYDAIAAGGSYYGSAIQAPEEDARAALEAALKVVEGESVPPKTFFDTQPFTKDTVKGFKRPVI